VSDLSITLARISTDPSLREEYPGDRQALKDAAVILSNLTVEHGLRAPDGIVIAVRESAMDDNLTIEQFVAKRVHDAPDYWTAVTRQVAATDWEEQT
jgi:hypothetical protein